MATMTNYSVIIPHKNIPELLRRCLDSIPVRDDVQVIVVDDNSDADKVDFEHFPGLERSDVEVFFTKEGRGAGYARNVGLQNAVGKWVLFADADDFFTEEYGALLDETVDANEDLVFFNYKNVLSEDVSQEVEKRVWFKKYISAYLRGEGESENRLRTDFVPPWGKLVKRDLIERNGIRFDEVKWGNDVWFSAQVAVKARTISVNERVVYVLTERPGSLAYDMNRTQEELQVRLEGSFKRDALFVANGYKSHSTVYMLNSAYRVHGFWWLAMFCMKHVFEWQIFKITANYLWPIFKEKAKKHLKWEK